MPDRRRSRGAKSSYDESMQNLKEQLEALDHQIDEIEAQRFVQELIEDQHAIQKRLRRKMH